MTNTTLAAGSRAHGTPAERLLRALTDPKSPLVGAERYTAVKAVSAEELGTLIPAALRIGASSPAELRGVRYSVMGEAESRTPRYTPEGCREVFEALAEACERPDWPDLAVGLGALDNCTGPLPDVSGPARTLVRLWLAQEKPRQSYTMLAVADLAGGGALRSVSERLRGDSGAIVADEIAVVAGLSRAERALVARARDFDRLGGPPADDLWLGPAGIPA
ncbi:MAG: hypothetical protein HOY76_53630, partial [Streptomyces sp.]|nr:hypothetical protein [Streptomyces sp.]